MKSTQIAHFIESNAIRGFLAEDEGLALYRWAAEIAELGACLEVGSYCGKSSVFIGAACKNSDNILYALDHHQGSEEHQLGEEYHDPDLYNEQHQCMDSLPQFRRTLKLAELEEHVLPVVTKSAWAHKNWQVPLGFVFIDGGHSHEMALDDCQGWSKHIVKNGILAIHDIFEKPEDGGQGPYLAMQAMLDSDRFELVEKVNSLAILRCKQGLMLL